VGVVVLVPVVGEVVACVGDVVAAVGVAVVADDGGEFVGGGAVGGGGWVEVGLEVEVVEGEGHVGADLAGGEHGVVAEALQVDYERLGKRE